MSTMSTLALDVRAARIVNLSFRIEKRDPETVPQSEWATRFENVVRNLKEHPSA
jgi:hypothetical protein